MFIIIYIKLNQSFAGHANSKIWICECINKAAWNTLKYSVLLHNRHKNLTGILKQILG